MGGREKVHANLKSLLEGSRGRVIGVGEGGSKGLAKGPQIDNTWLFKYKGVGWKEWLCWRGPVAGSTVQ